MKHSTFLSVILVLSLVVGGGLLYAQEAPPDPEPGADSAEGAVVEEEILEYEDYSVKAYSLSIFGGQFSGTTYLENPELDPRTIEPSDIIAYDGTILPESLDTVHYGAAHKEIEPGPAIGGRIGIFISDDFHIDLLGTYAQGKATTTMMFTPDPEGEPDTKSRVQVDEDPNFKVYKGGIALMYDARPATVFGITPKLGFSLGGVINKYTYLQDKTALYLEGNFGLSVDVSKSLAINAQADVTTFAFEVDELGYSNMVGYTTLSLGVTWFIDVLPDDIRAAHEADRSRK